MELEENKELGGHFPGHTHKDPLLNTRSASCFVMAHSFLDFLGEVGKYSSQICPMIFIVFGTGTGSTFTVTLTYLKILSKSIITNITLTM